MAASDPPIHSHGLVMKPGRTNDRVIRFSPAKKAAKKGSELFLLAGRAPAEVAQQQK
jgi:hypothetical protein